MSRGSWRSSDAAWGRPWAACWNALWNSISRRLDAALGVSTVRHAPPPASVASPASGESVWADSVRTPNLLVPAVSTRLVASDTVLGLAAQQVLSVGLHAWVAETGAEVPFHQAAERLERLTGIGLGTATARTHTQQVGTLLA